MRLQRGFVSLIAMRMKGKRIKKKKLGRKKKQRIRQTKNIEIIH